MNFRITSILFVASIIVSCNDDNVISNNDLPSGRATLASKVVNFKAIGFSFAKGDTVIVSSSSTFKADIITLAQTNVQGQSIGVFMGPITARPTFRLMYESTLFDSSKTYFQNLREFSDSTYATLAIPVRMNQVWLIKTHDDKFAKMLTVNTVAYDDSSKSSAPTPYGEITFDWVYQPSGEQKF
jgi:hypothetical protein